MTSTVEQNEDQRRLRSLAEDAASCVVNACHTMAYPSATVESIIYRLLIVEVGRATSRVKANATEEK